MRPKRAFSASNGHWLELGLGLGKICWSHSRLGEYRPNWVAVALQLPQELPKVKYNPPVRTFIVSLC